MEIEKLCPCLPCVSLRRELCTIFGVPKVREGQTWNEAILYSITQELSSLEIRDATGWTLGPDGWEP